MEAPKIPEREAERLESLDALGLMYTPSEERFDRITRMASRLFGTPIALVTLVSERCQWFKSAQGLDALETPREISFCGHAILGEQTFVVENALDDRRFADNPLVTDDPHIRFYAGHPIFTEDGSAVGTMCVIDRAPRPFSESERQVLRDLAAMVEGELARERMTETQRALIAERDELERKASIDGLTRLWNRETIERLLNMEVSRASRGKPLSVAMIDVDKFKPINDTHGHPAGDAVLQEIATRIRAGLREFDSVGRFGGDEFIAVLSDCKLEDAAAALDRIRQTIAQTRIATTSGVVSPTISIGVASYATTFKDAGAFVEAADEALYKAKKGGGNRMSLAGMDRTLEPPGMTSWRQRKRW